MKQENNDSLIDLLDRVERVQSLLGLHAEQAGQLSNAAIQYNRTSANVDATAALVAAANVNGNRMAALGDAALLELAEVRTRLSELIPETGN